MEFINLTPHTLNILDADGEEVLAIEPSGDVARVSTEYNSVNRDVESIPTNVAVVGDVENLPEPREGVVYLVSGQVRSEVDREDVASPGPLVRDEGGKPIGAEGLTFAA